MRRFAPVVAVALGVGFLLACPPAEAGRLCGHRHRQSCPCPCPSPCPCPAPPIQEQFLIDTSWYVFQCQCDQSGSCKWAVVSGPYDTWWDAVDSPPANSSETTGSAWMACMGRGLAGTDCSPYKNTVGRVSSFYCPLPTGGFMRCSPEGPR